MDPNRPPSPPRSSSAAMPPLSDVPADDRERERVRERRQQRRQRGISNPIAGNDGNDAARRSPSPMTSRPLPSPSHGSLASFQAASESGTEYFPPLPTDIPLPAAAATTTTGRQRSSVSSIAAANAAAATTSTPGFTPQHEYNHPLRRKPSREPSIRIRRKSNASSRRAQPSQNPNPPTTNPFDNFDDGPFPVQPGRARSVSQPERGRAVQLGEPGASTGLRTTTTRDLPAMPRLTEEGSRPNMGDLGLSNNYNNPPLSPTVSLPADSTTHDPGQAGRRQDVGRRKFSRFLPGYPYNTRRASQAAGDSTAQSQRRPDEYDDQMVDWLDVIDPEVQTLSTLTNIQNSLFVPELGRFVNRRATYTISDYDDIGSDRRRIGDEESQVPPAPEREEEKKPDEGLVVPRPAERTSTITSRLTESHYAALPHGTTLEGWTPEEKAQLDDRVRHMLHSRRSKFKRRLKGFGQYVRRPLGFLVTLYATLITLFGLAWVLFLIGWIYVGEKQVYAIHIIDSVLVALFAIVGDGLAPFRAIDTYHMIYIWRYSHIIKKAKKGKFQKRKSKLQKRGMSPELRESMDRWNSRQKMRADEPVVTGQEGDLSTPEPTLSRDHSTSVLNQDQDVSQHDFLADGIPKDIVEGKTDEEDDYTLHPLTPAQQKSLKHHQHKLAKSHSFYKPDETFTHFAFPLGYLIAIVILLDCHSCLQISLGATTWGIDYHTRPFALTTVILCVSITCNITAGIVISRGDKKTRKKDIAELLNRQSLTEDAMKKIEKKAEVEQKAEERASKEASRENNKAEGKDDDSSSGKHSSMIRKLTKDFRS